MTEEKRCENCAYYRAHYMIQGGRFRLVSGATCLNTDIIRSVRTKCATKNLGCDRWKERELYIQQEKDVIEKILRNMQERLEQIEQILASFSGGE